MADMEKDGINKPDEPENLENTELEKELNELKDLFQKELDNASENDSDTTDENEGELIQQLDDESGKEPDEHEEELPLCQCCDEKPCSTAHGEDYPYCDDCRNLMVKYPIRFTGVLAFVLTVVFFFGGIYLAQNEIMDSTTVLEASLAYSSRHMTTAYSAYSQYFSSVSDESVSKRAVREAVETYMTLGSTNEVSELVETYYTEDELKRPWNKNIKKSYDFCEKINATTEAVYQTIVMPALYNYISFDAAIEQLEEFIEETDSDEQQVATPTDAQQSEPGYDKLIAEYFIYYLMVNGDYDNEVRYEQIEKIAELGGEDYEWMYAPALAMMAAEVGKLDVVEACSEIIKKNNLDDVSAYTTLAHYYFRQDKIDTAKILEICKQADEAFPSGNELSHYRYYAAAYLLEGEKEKALSIMEEYVADGLKYYSDGNLYALCGLANGKEEIYDEMAETLTGYNYKISEYVDQYKEGKITIEEIFNIGGGDFI